MCMSCQGRGVTSMLHNSFNCSVQTDTFTDQIVGYPHFVRSQNEGTVLLPGVQSCR